VAQREGQEAEAHHELSRSLTRPSSSVFVSVAEDWVTNAKALLAYEALRVFPTLRATLDSGFSGLAPRSKDFGEVGAATADFLDGPVRFIGMYETSIVSVYRGYQIIRDLTHAAANLSTVTDGLKITLDIDPTLSREEQAAIRARQRKLSSDGAFRQAIQFRDVHFVYPIAPTKRVLSGLSFDIPYGQTTGIIGATGHGKSTLFKLLKRLYHPQVPGATAADIAAQTGSPDDHSIYIDGVKIDEFDTCDMRTTIGYVPQHPVLLSGTVFDNIAFGHPATEEQVRAAAKQARCHDFISAMPLGYQQRIQSNRLSGGEKQRIAIARALVRNPVVLLLDEATSDLDAENEAHIHQAISEFAQGRTVVIISHRLATLQNATHIVSIENGVCTEQGPPQQLQREHPFGIYARYMREQALQQRRVADMDAGATTTTTGDVGSLNPDGSASDADGTPRGGRPSRDRCSHGQLQEASRPSEMDANPLHGWSKEEARMAALEEIAVLRAMADELGPQGVAVLDELESRLRGSSGGSLDL
jgi:ABC-type methionine transport system ATPase subunit